MRIAAFLRAAPQGSKRHVGNGVMIEQSKRVRPYRKALTAAAIAAKGKHPAFDGPVRVNATFVFQRPKSHKKGSFPVTRSTGDLDKLLRSTFDALTDAGVWGDDSQVTSVNASKLYGESDQVILLIEPDVPF